MFTQDSMINKLIVLFVLEKMEIPLTENSILDICSSGKNPWINYMECKEILFDLLEANFIYRTNEVEDEQRYNITMEGTNCLSHFYQRIPATMRENIAEFAKENRMHFKRSQEYLGDYRKNSDGSYTVILKIRAPLISEPILELKIKAPSRESAIDACRKWRDKAHVVYEWTYETLIDTVE